MAKGCGRTSASGGHGSPAQQKYSPDDGRYPLQPALFGDASTYYMVPIERIDHIEVIKGGASVPLFARTRRG